MFFDFIKRFRHRLASACSPTALCLLYVLVAASFVYFWANREILANPYLINDDVRQQIYWMQRWYDPGLFPDDLLTRYAQEYVPWGVQAVYWVASWFVEPVAFSNILTGILYVISAGFFFGIGLRFRDDLTAVCVALSFFLCAAFLHKMAGGLSRSFVVPLLAAYLYFLSVDKVFAASAVILVASFFNPYVFLLCVATHGLYVLHRFGPGMLRRILDRVDENAPGLRLRDLVKRLSSLVPRAWLPSQEADPVCTPGHLLLLNLPFVAAMLVTAVLYGFCRSSELGGLVGWQEMVGKIEYTSAGRYELVPVPSMLYEVIRPWLQNLFVGQWSALWGILGIGALAATVRYALGNRTHKVEWSSFTVFAYLFPASLILYTFACVFVAKLFVPRRYIEYSLNFFYCISLAVCLRMVVARLNLRPVAFWGLTTLMVLLSAVRLHNMELYDYSAHAGLFRFLQGTPKESLIAGHPQMMDSIPTFALRKVFVNQELSHTWVQPYWSMIKKRTSDLFVAYYSDDPGEVRRFCKENGIAYMVVREEDFSRTSLTKGGIYFEPFDREIRTFTASRTDFALLNEKEFPRVYSDNGFFVVRIDAGGEADRL
ncbi:MAG: hypothetical protein AB1646_18000 [Thermodesulfobacteriota bacterium]